MAKQPALPSATQIIKNAWHQVGGSKTTFFLLLLSSIVWVYIVAFIGAEINLQHWLSQHPNIQLIILPVIGAITASFMICASMRAGIDRARGVPLKFKEIAKSWKYLHEVIIYLFCMMLIASVLSNILLAGMAFIAPTLMLKHSTLLILLFVIEILTLSINTLLILGIPMIVDRQVSIFNALFFSYRLVKPHFGTLFKLVIIFYLMGLLSALTAGIALIWLIPLVSIAIAQVYETLRLSAK